MIVGVDPGTSRRAIELAERYEVWAGAAYHPTETQDWTPEWAETIDELLFHRRVRAVGETGLDYYWDTSYVDKQKEAFAAHLELSKKHDKALVIHTRESVDGALDSLEELGPPSRLVFHCWSGDEDQLARALALGAYISFAGNVSFKKNEALRSAARKTPADRLLVETDSPYLTPEPHRGEPNEPAYVVHVGAAVAAARASEVHEIASLTTTNASTVFGI